MSAAPDYRETIAALERERNAARAQSDEWFRLWQQASTALLTAKDDIADAWDDGFTACANEHTTQRRNPNYPITRVNPHRTEATA